MAKAEKYPRDERSQKMIGQKYPKDERERKIPIQTMTREMTSSYMQNGKNMYKMEGKKQVIYMKEMGENE